MKRKHAFPFKRFTAIGSALFIIAAVLLSACSPSKETAAEDAQDKKVPITTATVEKGTITESTRLTAKLEPIAEASLAPQGSGKVDEILVDIGDKVTAGQELVKLDRDHLISQVNQASAGLKVAQAGYQQALEQAEQRVIQAQNGYLNARQSYADAKINFERMDALYQSGAISKQQWEQSRTAFIHAEGQYNLASKEYQNVIGAIPAPASQSGNAPDTMPTLPEVNSAALAPQLESAQLAKAQSVQAQASLQNAQSQLDNAVLTSPIDGVVANRQVHVGEIASAQMPILYVVNLDNVIIRLNVPESLIGSLKEGQEIDVKIPSANQTVKGKVTAVSPAADKKTLAFPVKIEIDNSNKELKSGMVAQVDLTRESRQDTLIIPTSALLEENGIYRVFVVEEQDGKTVAKERIVERGIMTSDRVEITKGLSADERIVIRGKNILSDGAVVEIVPSSEGTSREGDGK